MELEHERRVAGGAGPDLVPTCGTESQNTGPLPKARVKRARSQKPKSTISRGVGKRARSQNTECKTQNATGKVRKKQNTEYRTQKRSVGKLSWESEGKTQNTEIWRERSGRDNEKGRYKKT